MNRTPDPGAAVDAALAADSLVAPDSTQQQGRTSHALEDDLRRRWQHGERMPVEAYFEREPALAGDEEAAIDLIYCEFLLRSEAGEAPTLDEYLRRFPQYGARLQFLLAFDEVVCDLIRSNSVTHPRSDAVAAPQTAAAILEDAPTLIGGKYRVIELLDRGGQAEVYRALHETLRRDVVIKLSRRPCPEDSPARAGFLAEGRILAGLEHPHLAAVYDLDFHDGRAFLAMEYITGRTLEQHARAQPPAPAEAAALVARAARAVAAAHARGVVHRDLKPRNILIDALGRPRVIDFGLAQLHDAWHERPADDDGVSGTLPFMPPEQASAPPSADARTDVFALGAVLYFLLTGRTLYTGADVGELLAKARRCAYDRAALDQPAIPPRLRAICLKALSPDPRERYADAGALADALDALARPARRARWFGMGLATIALAGLAMFGWHAFVARPFTYDATVPTVKIEVQDNRPGAPIRTLHGTPATGSAIRVIVRPPDSVAAALFHVTSAGAVRKLQDRPGDSQVVLIVPADGTLVLSGQGPVTELFLAVGRARGTPIEEAEVRDAVAGLDVQLSALPREQYLRLMRDQVLWEPRGRDITRGAPSPEWAAYDQLEQVRQALRGRFDYFEGVAFTHR